MSKVTLALIIREIGYMVFREPPKVSLWFPKWFYDYLLVNYNELAQYSGIWLQIQK